MFGGGFIGPPQPSIQGNCTKLGDICLTLTAAWQPPTTRTTGGPHNSAFSPPPDSRAYGNVPTYLSDGRKEAPVSIGRNFHFSAGAPDFQPSQLPADRASANSRSESAENFSFGSSDRGDLPGLYSGRRSLSGQTPTSSISAPSLTSLSDSFNSAKNTRIQWNRVLTPALPTAQWSSQTDVRSNASQYQGEATPEFTALSYRSNSVAQSPLFACATPVSDVAYVWDTIPNIIGRSKTWTNERLPISYATSESTISNCAQWDNSPPVSHSNTMQWSKCPTPTNTNNWSNKDSNYQNIPASMAPSISYQRDTRFTNSHFQNQQPRSSQEHSMSSDEGSARWIHMNDIKNQCTKNNWTRHPAPFPKTFQYGS